MSIIYSVILFICGCLICAGFIYIRVFAERFPKEIEFVWNVYVFCIYMFLLLFFCYLLKQKLYYKESKNPLIIWLKTKIILNMIKFYDNALLMVYDTLIDKQYIPIKPYLQLAIYKIYDIFNWLSLNSITQFF